MRNKKVKSRQVPDAPLSPDFFAVFTITFAATPSHFAVITTVYAVIAPFFVTHSLLPPGAVLPFRPPPSPMAGWLAPSITFCL